MSRFWIGKLTVERKKSLAEKHDGEQTHAHMNKCGLNGRTTRAGCKKSQSQSIRHQLLVREEKRGNFTPALALLSWPAVCSAQGNPLDVTYILIFMNALIAPLKTLP